jgi:hypothetical protein
MSSQTNKDFASIKNRIDALLGKVTKIQDRYQQKDCSQVIARFKQEHKETLKQHRQEQKRLRLDLSKPIDRDTFHANFARYTFFLFNSDRQVSQLLKPPSKLRSDIYRLDMRSEEKKNQQEIFQKNAGKNFRVNQRVVRRYSHFNYNVKYDGITIGTLSIAITRTTIKIGNLSINFEYRGQGHLLYIFYFVYHTFVHEYKNRVQDLEDYPIELDVDNEKVRENYKKYGFNVIKENRNEYHIKIYETMRMDKDFYKKFDFE